MSISLPALANAFYYAAAAVGLPSITGIILYSGYLLHRGLTSTDSSLGAVKNPDGVLIVLQGMATVLQGMARFLGFLGKYVMTGIGILSFFGLLLAVSFYFTGKGLHGHYAWARGLAFTFIAIALVLSLVVAVSVRGLPGLLALLFTIACALAFATLWRGFPG